MAICCNETRGCTAARGSLLRSLQGTAEERIFDLMGEKMLSNQLLTGQAWRSQIPFGSASQRLTPGREVIDPDDILNTRMSFVNFPAWIQ
jgi:hypothetical protein